MATTAGVIGAGAHAALGASTVRKICEKVLKWQASQGCQRIPNPRSLDEQEKLLGKSFQDALRRRYGTIGEKPCQQQLSADEIHFINGIPGVPSRGCAVHSDLPDLQTRMTLHLPSTCRVACDQIWQFRLANAGAKPNPNSDNDEEASLGRRLARLLIREHGDIGEGKWPSEKQLSSADVDYLRNTLDKPVSIETTNSTARNVDELHFISGIRGVHSRGCSVNIASAGAIEADVPVVKR